MLINQVLFSGNAVSDAKEVYEAGKDEPHVQLVLAWSFRIQNIERRCFATVRCYAAVGEIAKAVKRGENILVQGRLDAFDPLSQAAGMSSRGCAIVASSVASIGKIGTGPTRTRVYHPNNGGSR